VRQATISCVALVLPPLTVAYCVAAILPLFVCVLCCWVQLFIFLIKARQLPHILSQSNQSVEKLNENALKLLVIDRIQRFRRNGSIFIGHTEIYLFFFLFFK